MMRAVETDAATAWLAERAAGDLGGTGFDVSGWESETWVLHAMYRHRGLEPVESYDEQRRRAVASGAVEAEQIGDVSLEGLTLGGWNLGMTVSPGRGWQRLTWRELAEELAVDLVRQHTAPCFRWFPFRSWPINVQPPGEGSLDAESLQRLVEVLAEHTAGGLEGESVAFFAPATVGWEDEGATFTGPLGAVPALARGFNGGWSPSNLWPSDRSWFIYTDNDLWSTKVSGSGEVIRAVEHHPWLETIAWQPDRCRDAITRTLETQNPLGLGADRVAAGAYQSAADYLVSRERKVKPADVEASLLCVEGDAAAPLTNAALREIATSVQQHRATYGVTE